MRPNPGGNEQLTALAGILLVVFLAVEGATLLNLTALLTVHAFVGMFLLPVVALKMGSTAWRTGSYYLRREEYVRRGPPAFPLRVVVAPVVVASTIVLFGTGIYLLAVHETHGTAVGLHKASFVVWFVATAIHVLARLVRMWEVLRAQYPGLGLRLGLVAVTLLAGTAVAVVTLPGADQLQDNVTVQVGLDAS
jgi:glucan phosphoethanolaminetransferase (alkaline phosphatase superfamily)